MIWFVFKPFENTLIDIVDKDGLLIEVEFKSQILFGFERDDNYLCVSFLCLNLDITWGIHVKGGGPRG